MEDTNKTTESQGFGDDVAKLASAMRLDVAANKIANAMGKKDCGCKKRQEKLNQMFPYNKNENTTNEQG
jgi:hypothetical protein